MLVPVERIAMYGVVSRSKHPRSLARTFIRGHSTTSVVSVHTE